MCHVLVCVCLFGCGVMNNNDIDNDNDNGDNVDNGDNGDIFGRQAEGLCSVFRMNFGDGAVVYLVRPDATRWRYMI